MRLFIGIAPDDAMREALSASVALLLRAAGGRLVDAPLYHLTLAFLGEVREDMAPRVEQAMRMAAREAAPFALHLGGAGTFGDVLWRGVEASPELDRLVERLRMALDTSGILYDARPFRAHFTLARDTQARAEPLGGSLPDGCFTMRAVTLYESARVDGRTAYTPLAEVAL